MIFFLLCNKSYNNDMTTELHINCKRESDLYERTIDDFVGQKPRLLLLLLTDSN